MIANWRSPIYRIRRRPAPIGELMMVTPDQLQVTFWTQPTIDFVFLGNLEEDTDRWQQISTIIRSAGFTFLER